MFAPLGRRLALVNALVIVVVVAIVGVSALGVLRVRIARQDHETIVERAAVAGVNWLPLLGSNQAMPTPTAASTTSPPSSSRSEESDETDGDQLIEGGDTLVLGFDRTGALVINPRSLNVKGLPAIEGVALALRGTANTRRLSLSDAQAVEVYTMPVMDNGQIVGAVQAIQGRSEHDQTMRLLGLAIAGSAGLGVLLAAPAGLFLARRAMRPIDIAFEHQRTFVADAAHELRSPLTVLRANAELIERIPDMDRQELMGEVGSMVQEIDEMSRLVNDLLDLAKADAGRLIVHTQPIELGDLIRDAVGVMAPLAESSGLSLSVAITAPVFVRADPSRIRQLVRVLVDNAISYTASGGDVHVLVEQRGSLAVIEVRDTGIGIPPEELQNVFRRFYRTDHARARSVGGAGLGLSIAHAIAVAHGGDIQVESVPGHGAVFRIIIPGAQTGDSASPKDGANVSSES